MRFLPLVLVALLAGGCGTPTATDQVTGIYTSDEVGIVRVRGCDYVALSGMAKGGIVHAGDCPNPLHKYNDARGLLHFHSAGAHAIRCYYAHAASDTL